MDDSENTSGQDIDPAGAQETEDQDSEATLNAPEEDRADGLVALEDDDSESTGGEGSVLSRRPSGARRPRRRR